jgi:ankyrin repeat protein
MKTLRIATFITLVTSLTSLRAIEPGARTPKANATAQQNRYAQFSQEEKDNFLIHEVAADHSGNVYLLIEAGANVNYIDHSGKDAMEAAFEQSNIAILEMLLKAGALDNTDAITCIDENIRTYEEARAYFLQKVIEAKAINPRKYANILSWAKKRGGYPDLIDVIEKRNKELSPEVQMAEWYKKLSPETRKQLLIQAVEHNELATAKELIAYGADVNAEIRQGKTDSYGSYDSCGYSAEKGTIIIKPLLVIAIEASNIELVRLLLDHKADLTQCSITKNIDQSWNSCATNNFQDNSKTYVQTPLSIAIQEGNKEIIKLLKAAGAQ